MSARAPEPKRLRGGAWMTLDEPRIVLPGIQALFGFRLIAVFSEGFRALAEHERLTNPGSLLPVAAAIALIMTPAAYDRIVDEREFSHRSIRLASPLVTIAPVPLALGLAIGIYVVASHVVERASRRRHSSSDFFVLLWVALPRLRRACSSSEPVRRDLRQGMKTATALDRARSPRV